MSRFLLICFGGALGTGARYLVTGWAPRLFGISFPWGTMICNLAGSFVMGLVMTIALSSNAFSPTTRLLLSTGVLGGFTTYSSFNYESLSLVQERDWLFLALYVGGTVLGCLVAGVLGVALGRAMVGD